MHSPEIERDIEKQVIHSVAVLAFKPAKVLLVKHKQSSGHKNGTYGIPGGRKNIGETDKQAAVREFIEETGLMTTEDHLLSFPHNLYTGQIERKDGDLTIFSMQVYIAKFYSGFLKVSDEVDPEWVDFLRMSGLQLLPNVEKAVMDSIRYMKSVSRIM